MKYTKDMRDTIAQGCSDAFNTLTKWQRVFLAKMMGMNTFGGSISNKPANQQAMSDLFEKALILRAEQNAYARILIEKGVITQEELTKVFAEEALAYSKALEDVFPGFRATLDGMAMDVEKVKKTTANWGS